MRHQSYTMWYLLQFRPLQNPILQNFPLPGYKLPSPPITPNQAPAQPEGAIANTAAFIRQHKKNLISEIQQLEGSSQDIQNISPCFINPPTHDFWDGCNWGAAQSFSIANLRSHSTYQRVRSLVHTTLQADFALCNRKEIHSASLVVGHHIMVTSHG